MCINDASYLIIEGLSDFGLELADFLVVRGAKNIVIASGSKNTRTFSKFRVGLWRGYGVTVVIREELDLSKQQNVKALLKEASALGRVDAIFDLQRIDNSSKRSSSSKNLFTKFLDEESKRSYSSVRKLVVCSTSKNIEENVNDVFLRETALVKHCQQKSKEDSLGVLVILGPIEGVAESKTRTGRKVPLLNIPRILETFDKLIELNVPVVAISHKYSIEQFCKVRNNLFD